MQIDAPASAQDFQLHASLAVATTPLIDWPLTSLRVMNDARWPWLILVPRVAGMRDLVDLDARQQAILWSDITRCSLALRKVCAPHKLNVAALGNVVAQLHVHVIARYETDPAWPAPVWGHGVAVPYSDAALVVFKQQIATALADP
ncbi:MAG: HIT domain-containing protein [Pseudomarimonas sp.]